MNFTTGHLSEESFAESFISIPKYFTTTFPRLNFIEKIEQKVSRIVEFLFRQHEIYRQKTQARKKKYIYRIDLKHPAPTKRKKNPKFNSLKITILTFLIVTHKQFKKQARKSRRKDGTFNDNYLSWLEYRIVSLVYRISIIANLFDSIKAVKARGVWINKKFITYLNFVTPLMTIVGFNVIFKGYIYWKYMRRLRRKSLLSSIPKFCFFAKSLFCFFILRYPRKRDFINPFKLDVYRATGYAN